MKTDRSPVVVGFDGTRSAIEAQNWALAEARCRKVPLRLVYAYSGARAYASLSMYGNLPMPEAASLRSAAEKVLIDAAARLAEESKDVEVSTHAYDGDAAAVLLEEARHACTIVLGSRRLGALGATVLGSVGTAVSSRASCPVVVTHGSADVGTERPAVVVGVQPDENCVDAIAYAFDYASRHGLPVNAILCWRPDLLADRLMLTELTEGAQALLSEALAGWREKYPDVEVEVEVEESVVLDHCVDGLVFAAGRQHLLVVGTHGRGALAGMLLGSVSQGVLHHANCPVAVVSSRTTR